MATSPSFISTPIIAAVTLSASNTNIDGSGTITTVATGAVTGTRVLEIVVQCAQTSSSALVNLFITTDSGSTWRLFDQISVNPATVSGTDKAFRSSVSYSNLVLRDSTYSIGATSTIAQNTNVIAFGGNL